MKIKLSQTAPKLSTKFSTWPKVEKSMLKIPPTLYSPETPSLIISSKVSVSADESGTPFGLSVQHLKISPFSNPGVNEPTKIF